MTREPEENVTDASPSQTEPDSGLEPSGEGPGDAAHDGAPKPPRWSDSQPAPAPWFVGQPGGGPQAPPQAGWEVPMPPQQPMPQQQPAPPRESSAAPGAPSQDTDSAGARVSAHPEDQAPEAQGDPESQQPPIAPPPAPQGPYGQPLPPAMPPWHGPSPYGPPQHRPQPPPNRQDDPWQRQRQPRQPAEQDKRAPLDLRTRWARGLALGAIACTMASIWYSVSNFPTWMVGAGAGLVLGLTGLWLGVFAQRAALARNKRAPEAVGAIVWSSIAALLSLMILAFSLIFYTQLSQLSNCLHTATTISAQNQCETNFQHDFGTRG
jgi:hypothetical protein